MSVANDNPDDDNPDDYPLAGWLTVDEVARQLRVTDRTVYSMVGDGRLSAVKHANQLLFPPTTARDYFARLLEGAGQGLEAARLTEPTVPPR